MHALGILTAGLCLLGCVGLPAGVKPVENFELDRYLGRWYEIARLDHSFERGLSAVVAEYSMREDGGVRVINAGFSQRKDRPTQAVGRAYFTGEPNIGHLKVSFFGPFYGSYAIFELDDDYQYAFVAGSNTNYLWLLARTPSVDNAIITRFTEQAKRYGFNTDELIFIEHPAL